MSKIKPDQFVQLWLEACENKESIGWIAGTLNVSATTVCNLAANLRRNGVELPPIRRPFVEPVDVKALNERIKRQWGR